MLKEIGTQSDTRSDWYVGVVIYADPKILLLWCKDIIIEQFGIVFYILTAYLDNLRARSLWFLRTFDFSYQYWKVLLNKSLGFQRFTPAGYSFDVSSNVNNISLCNFKTTHTNIR